MLSIMISFFQLLVLTLTTTQVLAKIVNVEWTIEYTSANPDGLFSRKVVGVNGHWP